MLVSGARTKNECFCCQVGFEATRVSLFIHSEKICWAKGSPACYPEMLVPRYDIWQIAYSRLTSSYFCICMWPAQLRPIFLPLRPARYQSTAAQTCSDVGSCARKQESSPDGKMTPRMKGEDLLLAVQLIQSVYKLTLFLRFSTKIFHL